jgi:prevent-host-death family protein
MWTLRDAKNRFSAVVAAALAGRPQQVTRRGRPAVVVLSAEEYHRLVTEAASRRDSFADHLLHFPGGEPERLQARLRDSAF